MVDQPSLLELGTDPAVLRPLGAGLTRTELTDGAWVDVGRAWVVGARRLFDELMSAVPWRAERRRMYDRVVAVPRLMGFYDEAAELPHPLLVEARRLLSEHYGPELGEPLRTAGCCLYRSGQDSVAWHGDTIGRGATEDTVVAIVSLGATRGLLLRPRSGGPSLRFDLAGGDVLVMGGSCQRTWEHAVPKTARAVGPRISVQFRPRGVR